MNERTELRIKVNRARYNLMFMVILTAINIFSGSVLMPFSLSVSTYANLFGISASAVSGSAVPKVIGIILACAAMIIVIICYYLMKSKAYSWIVAIALVIADTLALCVIGIISGTIISTLVILDIAIHAVTVFYLLKGIRAFEQLQKISTITEDTVEADTNSGDSDVCNANESPADDTEEDITKPISKYTDNGADKLVSGEYEGLNIFTVFEDGKALLVINGYVCDALIIADMSEFELRAIVNGIDIIFQYRRFYNAETMFLYADDTLLDSLGRE